MKNRSFQIGVGMYDKDKVEMLLLLVQNVDVFAWSPYEVPGGRSGVYSSSI